MREEKGKYVFKPRFFRVEVSKQRNRDRPVRYVFEGERGLEEQTGRLLFTMDFWENIIDLHTE